MGASSSSLIDLKDNAYLKRFISTDPIGTNDPFWNQFLSFSFVVPVTCSDARLLEETVSEMVHDFSLNNLVSGNFRSLLVVFLRRANELVSSLKIEPQDQDGSLSSMFIWQLQNALFILRCITKFLIENGGEDNFLMQILADPNKAGKGEESRVDILLDELLETLMLLGVYVPVRPLSYGLHLEMLNSLMVLLSVQMYSKKPAMASAVYHCVNNGRCSNLAVLFTRRLFQHFLDQEPCPPHLLNPSDDQNSRSLIGGIFSGLLNIMTIGYASKRTSNSVALPAGVSSALLATKSVLILLILTNHCSHDRVVNNPYRLAVFSCADVQEEKQLLPGHTDDAVFFIDFNKLYKAFCDPSNNDETTLLLYLVLHRNAHFREFVLSRTDVDLLVSPILKVIYSASKSSSHHVYMALIILLILSEDQFFSSCVHQLKVKSPPWYQERSFSEIRFGSLLVLVIIRTIQFNITRMRDKYLHTNCLAALANMSAQFDDLHPYVCQRLVGLFEALSKKHTKLLEQGRQISRLNEDEEDMPESENNQDMTIVEEVMRMVLEIMNSCLSEALPKNPHLIYTMLYKRDVFQLYRTHPNLNDLIQNVETVLAFFSSKLEFEDRHISPQQVTQIIETGLKQFPKDRLKKFPELKFRYVEEEEPEEFFVPYVWTLVYHSSGLYWAPERIQVFQPPQELSL